MQRVLMIRPHDFIADAMSAALKAVGVAPDRVDRPTELEAAPLNEVCGAVVSLAVTSAMPLRPVEAVRLLWARKQVPLIATTLIRDPQAALEGARLEIATELKLLPEGLGARGSLGRPTTLLVLRQEDLTSHLPGVLAALRSHLGVTTGR
jgi:hypothetical protein